MSEPKNDHDNDLHSVGLLIQRFVEGTISEPEVVALAQILRNKAELRSYLAEHIDLDSHLRELNLFDEEIHEQSLRFDKTEDELWAQLLKFKNGDHSSFFQNLIMLERQSPSVEKMPIVPGHAEKTADTATKRRGRRRLFASLAGLLLLAVGLCWGIVRWSLPGTDSGKNDSSELYLATVTHFSDVVFAENTDQFRPGQKISTDDLTLKQGFLGLRLANGVRIVLEGPGEFKLTSPMKAFCRSGRLSVEIPPQATGFEVQSPLLNIRDIGTKFLLEVSDETCTAHVIQGKIEVKQLTGNWVEVNENVAIAVHRDFRIEQTLADKSLFVEEARMNEMARQSRNRIFSRWERCCSRWKNDPLLYVYTDFSREEDEVRGDEEGKVVPYVGNWQMERGVTGRSGCEEIAGHRDFGRALSFSKPGDRVKVSAPSKSKAFTLMAVVRLDALAASGHPLFSIGDDRSDALHWQINSMGQMQLLTGNDKNEKRLDMVASDVFYEKRHAGAWTVLAVCVEPENEIVTFYCDGDVVSRMPWKSSKEFDFTAAEIGNWEHKDRSEARFGNFGGAISEFILLGRGLTEEEITSMNFYEE